MKTNSKIHTTNYADTFIEVAEDCPVATGTPPPSKESKKSIAEQQYELLNGNPYQFTSDDVLFQVYADRNLIDKKDYRKAREEFFSKGQPCFRASPLPKKFGFGIHADSEGRIALYGVGSDRYRAFLEDPDVKKVKAMRTSKK